MLDRLYIVIPMAIHKVGYLSACSLWEVIGILLNDLMERQRLDDDYLLAIMRELETLYAVIILVSCLRLEPSAFIVQIWPFVINARTVPLAVCTHAGSLSESAEVVS